MKFFLVSLTLAAGLGEHNVVSLLASPSNEYLAISQASVAPVRVVVVSEHFSSSNGFVRVGHAAANLNNNVAAMHSVNKVHSKAKHGCAGRFRAKAMRLSNWFRHAFGLPPVPTETKADGVPMGTLDAPHEIEVARPDVQPHPHHHHHHSKLQHSERTFMERLTRALMILGPWEGRAVSFMLGNHLVTLDLFFPNRYWIQVVVSASSSECSGFSLSWPLGQFAARNRQKSFL